jgi:hypothetical protein
MYPKQMISLKYVISHKRLYRSGLYKFTIYIVNTNSNDIIACVISPLITPHQVKQTNKNKQTKKVKPFLSSIFPLIWGPKLGLTVPGSLETL